MTGEEFILWAEGGAWPQLCMEKGDIGQGWILYEGICGHQAPSLALSSSISQCENAKNRPFFRALHRQAATTITATHSQEQIPQYPDLEGTHKNRGSPAQDNPENTGSIQRGMRTMTRCL